MENNIEELENELYQLVRWFEWYDTQIMQHSRFTRMNTESNINLEELDQQAVIKAARIKELKQLIRGDLLWKGLFLLGTLKRLKMRC